MRLGAPQVIRGLTPVATPAVHYVGDGRLPLWPLVGGQPGAKLLRRLERAVKPPPDAVIVLPELLQLLGQLVSQLLEGVRLGSYRSAPAPRKLDVLLSEPRGMGAPSSPTLRRPRFLPRGLSH